MLHLQFKLAHLCFSSYFFMVISFRPFLFTRQGTLSTDFFLSNKSSLVTVLSIIWGDLTNEWLFSEASSSHDSLTLHKLSFICSLGTISLLEFKALSRVLICFCFCWVSSGLIFSFGLGWVGRWAYRNECIFIYLS